MKRKCKYSGKEIVTEEDIFWHELIGACEDYVKTLEVDGLGLVLPSN